MHSLVGIDAYSWLHKGGYACSREICEQVLSTSSGDNVPVYVKYCMHRINMLKFNNVTPVVVFDGGYLPQKAFTESERRRRKQINLEQARIKLSSGDILGANELFQRAIEITPTMAYNFIKVLKSEAVEFVVAPYEADAQLALLAKLSPEEGGIVAVISEDSDLLAYGCPVVIFKMDRFGNGEEIELKKVFRSDAKTFDCLSFRRFTQHLFIGMCILAGCDFLPSVPGIGLRKAHDLVSKYSNLDRVLSRIKFDSKSTLPEGYLFEFKQAIAIFQHARVYDSKRQTLCFLTPLPITFFEEFDGDIEFLGPDLPKSIAMAIAEGHLDPTTMCAFDEQPSRVIQRTSLPNGDGKPSSPFPLAAKGQNIEAPRSADVFALKSNTVYDTGTKQVPKVEIEQGKDMTSSALHHSSAKIEPDKTFIAQLQFIAAKTLNNLHSEDEQPSHLGYCKNLEDKQEAVGNFSTFEKKGLKRVFPLMPTNNPFKKVTAIKEGHDINITNTSSNQQTARIKQDWHIHTVDLPLCEDTQIKEASVTCNLLCPSMKACNESSAYFGTTGGADTLWNSQSKKSCDFNFLEESPTAKACNIQTMPNISLAKNARHVESKAAFTTCQSTDLPSVLSSKLFEEGEENCFSAKGYLDQAEPQTESISGKHNIKILTPSLQPQWNFVVEHRKDKEVQATEKTRASKVFEAGILKFFKRTCSNAST